MPQKYCGWGDFPSYNIFHVLLIMLSNYFTLMKILKYSNVPEVGIGVPWESDQSFWIIVSMLAVLAMLLWLTSAMSPW